MKRTSYVRLMVAGCLCAVSMTSYGQNLLLNNGFEDGIGTSADFWNMFGNATRETRAAMSGSYGIIEFGNFTNVVNYSGAYQDVSAAAGQIFYATVYVSTTNTDQIGPNNTAFLKLEFFDANTNQLLQVPASNPLTNTSPVDTWILQTVTATAPANTAFARTTLIFEQDTGAGGSAYFDNISLQANPEPHITHVNVAGTNTTVSFSSILGATHELEAKDDLATNSWSVVTNNITGTGGVMQVNDGFPGTQHRRFYRVKASY